MTLWQYQGNIHHMHQVHHDWKWAFSGVCARHKLELSLEFGNSSGLELPGLVRLELEFAQLSSSSSSQQHYIGREASGSSPIRFFES